ncbi:MAG TPA: hypothetical protein DEB40_11460 [Elusimicrobia bacterium]|nr:hypothetical protein [Elusimicrobiota bacterium]HBT62350.1 hypothetical protein [Elusimicrobiota bacterium]
MRVLVIDDEPSLSTLAVEYLRLCGHEAMACADGESALELLRRDSAFDVIILDQRLPGLSGADTFRAIRSDPNLKKLPVIVLSSGIQPGAIPADLSQAEEHMSKPFHPKDLAAAVARLSRKDAP